MHFPRYIFLCVVLWLLSACGPSVGDRPIVTVSIEPQRYLLEQIVGDKVDVRCLLAGNANPETYDPTVTNLMNVNHSLAFLKMGNIGFEEAVIDKIRDSNPTLPVFDTSAGITPIYGTHSHGNHVHREVDPHTWTSVKNAKLIAANMLAAMVKVDKGNEKYYRQRAARLAARLDSLDSVFTVALLPQKGKPFLVWHPSLSYMARDYGMKQIVMGGAENRETSPAALKAVIDSAKSHGSELVFFTQRDFDSRQASSVNASIGARTIDIQPMSYRWEDEMTKIVDALIPTHNQRQKLMDKQ